MTNFIHEGHINHILCDEIIEFHKSSDQKREGSVASSLSGERVVDLNIKESTDVVLNFNMKLYNSYCLELKRIVDDYILKYPSCNFYSPFGLIQEINIQHYKPNAGFKVWHAERSSNKEPSSTRHLVFMTYLNDVSDGGGTEFLNQNVIVQAKKGRTLIWPADWTYTHRGVISPSQEKYIVTGWFNFMDVNKKDADLSIS